MDVRDVWPRDPSPTTKNLQIPLSLLAQLEQNKQKKRQKKRFQFSLDPTLVGASGIYVLRFWYVTQWNIYLDVHFLLLFLKQS